MRECSCLYHSEKKEFLISNRRVKHRTSVKLDSKGTFGSVFPYEFVSEEWFCAKPMSQASS